MKKPVSVAALFILAVGLIAVRAEAAGPCPVGFNEGKRITVLVEGANDPDTPDVVLIPGLSSPRAVWDATAERLKARYRLHRVQIRGFGDDAGINAEGPVLEPMMQEVADYIDDCITDAGRPAPAVIGHSMGGLTGLMVAAGLKSSPMKGTASTIISLPTSCGARAAIISPVSPPIEWPITAGAGRPASVMQSSI